MDAPTPPALSLLVMTDGSHTSRSRWHVGMLSTGGSPDLPSDITAGYAQRPAARALDLLPAWGGGLLFAGYIAVTVLAARLITLRRDIT